MDVDRYLARISYRGSVAPTAENLRALHRAHMLTVPFENLDIGRRRPIHLESELLFHKIVEEHRGGFCYECNGLFAWLLEELGFPVAMHACEVRRADGTFGPPGDHMALTVDLGPTGGRWLADVGFGASFVDPLALDDATPSSQPPWGSWAVALDGAAGGRLQILERDGTWQTSYRFDLVPWSLDAFADGCHFHQTSPESHFTRGIITSMATAEGRISLSGRRLIVTRGTDRTERELSAEEATEALRDVFGIVLG